MGTVIEYFNERHSYVFENPNAAAVFFVAILPFLYFAGFTANTKNTWLIFSVRFLELSFTAALVFTQSRAGLIAILVAIVFWSFFVGRAYRKNISTSIQRRWKFALLCRFLLLFALVAFSAIGKRMLAMPADASVSNRLQVWRESLGLFAASPWNGWGKGMAGAVHHQWVQTLTGHAYSDMLNGYLQIAIDFGIKGLFPLMLAIALPYAGFTIAGYKRIERDEMLLGVACMAAYTGLLICHFSSTIWIYPPILFLSMGIYILAVYSVLFSGRQIVKSAIWSCLFACFCVIALYGLAAIRTSKEIVSLTRMRNGAICFTGGQGAADIDVYVDNQSLGQSYGNVLRRAFEENRQFVKTLTVYPPGTKAKGSSQIAVLLGAASERANDIKATLIYIFAPTRPVSAITAPKIRMAFLPEYEEMNIKTIFFVSDCPVRIIQDSGNCITTDFSKLLSQCCADALSF